MRYIVNAVDAAPPASVGILLDSDGNQPPYAQQGRRTKHCVHREVNPVEVLSHWSTGKGIRVRAGKDTVSSDFKIEKESVINNQMIFIDKWSSLSISPWSSCVRNEQHACVNCQYVESFTVPDIAFHQSGDVYFTRGWRPRCDNNNAYDQGDHEHSQDWQ